MYCNYCAHHALQQDFAVHIFHLFIFWQSVLWKEQGLRLMM